MTEANKPTPKFAINDLVIIKGYVDPSHQFGRVEYVSRPDPLGFWYRVRRSDGKIIDVFESELECDKVRREEESRKLEEKVSAFARGILERFSTDTGAETEAWRRGAFLDSDLTRLIVETNRATSELLRSALYGKSEEVIDLAVLIASRAMMTADIKSRKSGSGGLEIVYPPPAVVDEPELLEAADVEVLPDPEPVRDQYLAIVDSRQERLRTMVTGPYSEQEVLGFRVCLSSVHISSSWKPGVSRLPRSGDNDGIFRSADEAVEALRTRYDGACSHLGFVGRVDPFVYGMPAERPTPAAEPTGFLIFGEEVERLKVVRVRGPYTRTEAAKVIDMHNTIARPGQQWISRKLLTSEKEVKEITAAYRAGGYIVADEIDSISVPKTDILVV